MFQMIGAFIINFLAFFHSSTMSLFAFDMGYNECYIAAALSFLVAAPRWYKNIIDVIGDDLIEQSLSHNRGRINCVSANIAVITDRLVNKPNQVDAFEFSSCIELLFKMLKIYTFEKGSQADSCELIEVICRELCHIANIESSTPCDNDLTEMLVCDFTNKICDLIKVGPKMYRVFGEVKYWGSFARNVANHHDTIFMTPIPIALSPINDLFQTDTAIIVLTVDSSSYKNAHSKRVAGHYNVIVFHPNGKLFLIDSNKVVKISPKHLKHRCTVATVSVHIDNIAF